MDTKRNEASDGKRWAAKCWRDATPVRISAPRWLTICIILFLSLCAGASAADAWWDGAWTLRKKVTLDTTQAGAGISDPIGGATVLMRFFDLNYPAGVKEDLSDLRFVAEDGKTLLPYHVEKIDAIMGEAFVWVKLPDVKPNAKSTFWIYYGSNDAKAAKAEDAKATFDADTVAVFHFGESGQAPVDVTKNANGADGPGGKVEGAAIGGGIGFNSKTLVSIAPSPSLLWSGNAPVTISAWVKVSQPSGVILSRRDGEKSFVLGADAGKIYVEISGQPRGLAPQPLQPGTWAHVAVVCDPEKTTLYVNGEASAAIAAGMPGMNTALMLGGDKAPGATGFTGEMDELQIHKVARSVGWVQLAAYGQGGEKGPKTIVVGDQEQPTNWLSWLTTGYFGVIIKNLTFDGWAVIVILAVMAMVSWYVMVSKVRYLNGISKGNEIFMEQWRHVAADLTVLDDADAEKSRTLGGRVTKALISRLRRSSVYRIYHIGVEEIRHRLADDREQGVRRGLAGRSIQAIRAALDGGLVRETQKINKLIVLLTICISGGPFLGLLGTVIGVMITFAAVAAAGDVNVNAIAPGIAAALLATVAGLAVAIPALFGYNYILSRVKDAKDDMHIFIDEFVTKMAEFYKEKGE
jgi:biopolymer transport protein ExbB